MSEPSWLIVRQRPAPHAELESLVGELQTLSGLDPYTLRQHLLGPGLARLAQGDAAQLDGLAALLRRHGYPCWVLPPPRPAFAPPRLRSLVISAGAVDFFCEGERRIRLERGMAAVGVLADLSGELAGRQAKRMLAQHAYLGRDQATVFTPEEIHRELLKGQPVYDCYLLDDDGTVASAVRVFPGRFNPEGLGGRAGLGATRNLEAVATLVAEYAGAYRLHTDFGLSQIPGCQPQPAREDPLALLGNLEALTRYGWLVAALGEMPPPGSPLGETTAGAALAAGLGGMAALASAEIAADELTGIAEAVDGAIGELPVAVPPPVRPPPLPPPPDRPEPRPTLRRVLPAVALLAGGGLLVAAGRSDLLRPAMRLALHSGALPALLAAACCWGAFLCLRLKRIIEDTPTSRVRSLAVGLVEVHGRALRRYALVAPMTQSACVWYRLRKYRRDSNNRWTLTSESDSNHVPFLLDDGTGRAVIDPAGARVKPGTAQTGHSGSSTLIGAAVEGGPDDKWVEELIYEGTSLYVLGYARPGGGLAPGLRERTVEVLRRLKLDPDALHRYDTDGDGRLDADEWQAARDEAERQAAVEQLGEQQARSRAPVVIGKPPHGMPFLMAETQSDAALARRYGLSAAALFVLSAAAAGAALLLLLKFFWLS